MSASRTVPAAVLWLQSSRPVTESSAVKMSVLPRAVRLAGDELLTVPGKVRSTKTPRMGSKTSLWKAALSGAMLATRTVPAAVPSLFQSSRPVLGEKLKVDPSGPSVAAKKSVPPTLVRLDGSEPATPGLISRRRNVPAVVPSVRQSSRLPALTSSALKKRLAPATVRF